MNELVLISDGNTPLGKALTRSFYSSGMKILAALPKIPADSNTKVEYLEWNRSSAISAKNCLLQIKKVNPESAHFYLLPPLLSMAKSDVVDHTVFEQALDLIIKGNYYLVREIGAYLEQTKRGTLSLVHIAANKEMPVFYRIFSNSLAEFYDVLLEKWRESFLIRAFDIPAEVEEGALEFIVKHNDQKADRSWGKWLRLKKGLRLF